MHNPAAPVTATTLVGARTRLGLALVLVAATIVAPGPFGSAFAGPPLGETARWLLVGTLWLATLVTLIPPRRSVPLALLAVLACAPVAQVWLGTATAVRGWQGSYEMRDEPVEATRFAWRYRTHGFRIDPRIDFEGPNFGLPFLNDLDRYGQKYHVQHTRDVDVPLRIVWRGFATLPAPTTLSVFAETNGAVTVRLNGHDALSADSAVGTTITTAEPWPAGPLTIDVVYDKPALVQPKARVRISSPATGEVDVGPLGAPAGKPPDRDQVEWSSAVVMLSAGLLLGLLYWAYLPLNSLALRRAAWQGAVPAWAVLVAMGALLYAEASRVIPLSNDTVYMWAGDDPLAYVSNARKILLDGWLMAGNTPLGSGQPFYFYPLFGYVAGFAHWVIGEDFAVVRLVNGWSVAAVLPLVYLLGWRDRRWWAVVLGSALMFVFVRTHMLPYTQTGFTDSIFTGIVFLTLMLCRLAVGASPWWAPLAGVSCALAAAARPSFLTFTPLFLVAIVAAGPGAGVAARLRLAALVAAGFAVGMLPFALRNFIVSGQFVVLVSSWIQLPYFLIPPEAATNPVPGMFTGLPTLTESLWAALGLIAADPVGIAVLELRKLAFTLGITQWGAPGAQAHPEFIVLTVLYATAMVARRIPADVAFVIGVFSVSHIAAMVLAAPWTYGYKSILPLQAVFLFGALYLLPGKGRPESPTDGRSVERPHVARA